jgi:hypothetical protein
MKASLALAAAALLAGCAGTPPDPWIAQASVAGDAQAGVNSLVTSFAAPVTACEIGPVPLMEVIQQGTLGVASVGPATTAIVAPDEDCDGDQLPAVGLYFDAPAGASGIDTVTLRQFNGGGRPDVIHTAIVRVR